MKYPTVNKMIQRIERRVCIRKLWNCKAGWGMFYSYFPTLEQCIRMEYRYWVLGKKVRGHPEVPPMMIIDTVSEGR